MTSARKDQMGIYTKQKVNSRGKIGGKLQDPQLTSTYTNVKDITVVSVNDITSINNSRYITTKGAIMTSPARGKDALHVTVETPLWSGQTDDVT